MATESATTITRRRRLRGRHPKRVGRGQEHQPKPLPQYLEPHKIQAIIRAADDPMARFPMMELFRANWDKMPRGYPTNCPK